MKSLTVKQPWAWAIVAGHKRVENRSWTRRCATMASIADTLSRTVSGASPNSCVENPSVV